MRLLGIPLMALLRQGSYGPLARQAAFTRSKTSAVHRSSRAARALPDQWRGVSGRGVGSPGPEQQANRQGGGTGCRCLALNANLSLANGTR